ncbi:glycyl-radical enzyme activating family protein, partial [Vibrio sp. Y184]|nr:glycyl-radical enzyme activating family protein [Vibrio sp. Y184]
NPELLENAMQYACEHTQLNVIVRG